MNKLQPLRSVSAPPSKIDEKAKQKINDFLTRAFRPPSTTPRGQPMNLPRYHNSNSNSNNNNTARTDPEAYYFILKQIKAPGNPAIFAEWLRSLSLYVQDMSMENSKDLLHAIFGTDWTNDPEVQEAYLSLSLNFATSHCNWVPKILQSLFYHVNPKRVSTTSTDYDVERSQRVFKGILDTVKEILRLVPLSSTAVWQTIVGMYPHKRHDVAVQEAWLEISLQICRIVPSIRNMILETIIQKLLQMDVDITIDDDEEDEESDDEKDDDDGQQKQQASTNEELFFKMEDGKTKKHQKVSNKKTSAENAELATKLDALMLKLFEYYNEKLSENGAVANEEFELLLRHFMHVVLPTYKSKATQFLMFYACKYNNSFSDSFLSALLKKARDDTVSAMSTRIAACGYAASFLSRAKFLTPEIIERYLKELLDIAQSHSVNFQVVLSNSRQSVSNSSQSNTCMKQKTQLPSQIVIDPYQHQFFYASINAAMYVFCYEHERLIKSAKSLGNEPENWLHGLGFERILNSPLVPLRVCNQVVSKEFLSIWKELTGADCTLPEFTSDNNDYEFFSQQQRRNIVFSNLTGSPFTLEAFFPFDPYLLRVSSKFIDPLYNSWSKGESTESSESSIAPSTTTTTTTTTIIRPLPINSSNVKSEQFEEGGNIEDEDDEQPSVTGRTIKKENVHEQQQKQEEEEQQEEEIEGAVDIQRPTPQSAASSVSDNNCTPMSLGLTPMQYPRILPAVSAPIPVQSSSQTIVTTTTSQDVSMGTTPLQLGPISTTNFNFSYD